MNALPERHPGSTRVFPARLRGVDVHCVVSVNREEHERRERAEAGAINDRELLQVLLGLEPEMETPRAALPPSALRLLRRSGSRSVLFGRGTVTRKARVPLTVECVTVTDTDPERGLARASTFGPYCARVLSLPRLPADPVGLVLEASYLGIGISVPNDPQVVVGAAFEPMRFTEASWLFAEAAYEQLLGHIPSTRGPQ